MNIKKTLQNPFVLTIQGFVAGAVLFWSTQPPQAEVPNQVQAAVVVDGFSV